MKPNIESSVVQQIRLLQGVSRVELARQLSIAPSTVGIHVDRLVDQGYLRNGERPESTAGRPPTLIELNPEAGQFIGIDLDSRQVYGASVDFAQRLLRDRTVSVKSNESAEGVLKIIEEVINDVKDRSRNLLGIGIAVPGTVDGAKGMALHYRYIRGWQNLPLAERLQDRFGVPVSLENNIRAMAMAERWFGQGKTVDDYLCLGIRSGIGSGMVLGGELFRGPHNFAGEIGAWPCRSACGTESKTLEEVASLRAMLRQLTKSVRAGNATSLTLRRNRVTIDAMLAAAEENDPLVKKVLREAAVAVGRAVAQMTLLIDPEMIIVAGPIANTNDAFLAPLRDTIEHLLPPMHAQMPKVVVSELGDLVGALGAAALAVHAWQP
ncbi:Hypothetical protein PBC10988_16340 [Planctomycetales bacterium 10988]|nr:Hypothetical protein PBC10988_16340 [Planctomycetales bacterium 10988]